MHGVMTQIIMMNMEKQKEEVFLRESIILKLFENRQIFQEDIPFGGTEQISINLTDESKYRKLVIGGEKT